jgi:hypothetical protein
VEGYDATMWLLAVWKETSGQDLDALLVTDSESLQQKAVSTALPTEKRLRIDMTLLRQGLRRGEYGIGAGGLVEQPGESTDEGSSWHKSNNVSYASFAARFRDELYASRHGSYPYQNLGGCRQVLAISSRGNNAVGELSL